MTDDAQLYFNVAIAIIGGFIGWYLRIMWAEIKSLQRRDEEIASKISSIEVLVAGEYVKREWFEAKMDALFRVLDRINDKLDHKVDK